MKAFRVDRRNVRDGDPLQPTGDYCANLAANDPDRFKVEQALAATAGDIDRCQLLHLFESEHDALWYWPIVSDSCIYEVEFDEALCKHRGNMQLTEKIFDAIKAGQDPRDLVGEYWGGHMSESPRVELLVGSARVVRMLPCSDADKAAAKQSRWNLPDLKDLFAAS